MTAAPPVSLYRAAKDRISIGGVPETVFYGPILGGVITNPPTPEDQHVEFPEVLWIDLVGPAADHETDTTFALWPGESYRIPDGGFTGPISLNAATTGHRFSAYALQPQTPYPPTPVPGTFPPTEPTMVAETIPAYLYVQYNDDEDLAAFVRAQNELTQEYVDRFLALNLPIYTRFPVSGDLLNWVGAGLYGIPRPALASGRNRNLGPLNTFLFNVLPLNTIQTVGPSNVTVTNDDTYRRIITWNFYKGDGKQFNVRWLKRRIQRFLTGVDGIGPDISETYRISVTFGVNRQVNITLGTIDRFITGGALPNRFALNTMGYNRLNTNYTSLDPVPYAPIFLSAMETGVLQLPFQYTYIVTI